MEGLFLGMVAFKEWDEGDYYEEVIGTAAQDFGQDTYPYLVNNLEEKVELTEMEERWWGRPFCLSNALEQMLEYFLEWLQLYLRDPLNVL
ncbi:hypothetical protein C0989_005064 [Termitomyces sp. Mn162]|nr:hypothetical protein C0989_005064 [Termitomyces sp. Mn162]